MFLLMAWSYGFVWFFMASLLVGNWDIVEEYTPIKISTWEMPGLLFIINEWFLYVLDLIIVLIMRTVKRRFTYCVKVSMKNDLGITAHDTNNQMFQFNQMMLGMPMTNIKTNKESTPKSLASNMKQSMFDIDYVKMYHQIKKEYKDWNSEPIVRSKPSPKPLKENKEIDEILNSCLDDLDKDDLDKDDLDKDDLDNLDDDVNDDNLDMNDDDVNDDNLDDDVNDDDNLEKDNLDKDNLDKDDDDDDDDNLDDLQNEFKQEQDKSKNKAESINRTLEEINALIEEISSHD